MDGKLIILGCGGSAGVPAIGNWWGNCDPAEPRNLRTRPSIALQTETTLVIVDTGPDFREQMNREQLGVPDAIILTHVHSDHVNGIDELRILQRRHKRKFPVYAMQETMGKLMQRAGYMFESSEDGFYPAVCDSITLAIGRKLSIGDLEILPFEQDHGTIKSLGVRVGNVAYSTDVKRLDSAAYAALKGVDTWIVDAMGNHARENPVHACIEEIVEMNAIIGATQVFLTHLPPTMDYSALQKELPGGYTPAYDGMTLDFKA